MAGIIGFIMLLVVLVLGFKGYPFLNTVSVSSVVGFVLYLFLDGANSTARQQAVISQTQRSGMSAVLLIFWFIFAQIITWSIIYGIGKLVFIITNALTG